MRNDPFQLTSLSQQGHANMAEAIEKGDVNKLAQIMHAKRVEKVK